MIDRSFGDYGRMLRSPDLRLGDVRTKIVGGHAPFVHRIADPTRGVFVYVRRGDFLLDVDNLAEGPIIAPPGTAVGFESGRTHSWRALPTDAADDAPELFISSIPRRMGVLQSLKDGLIIVPPDAEPFATTLRHTVEVHYREVRNAPDNQDEGIIRRCAEICLIEFVRYARQKVVEQPDLPPGLAHDEYLLRAWSAYFADPQRRWTVKALADAAGLGRTAFALRFRDVFGAPPLQTLTALRLEQAEAMLRHGKAPLIEIAFTVGYNSEAAFVRAFHRQYGIPPGRFRADPGQG